MKNNKNIYELELVGASPLLHHRMPEETLMALLGSKRAQKKKPENDETPRQIADRFAYKKEDGTYYIPSTYLSGAFIEASSEYKMSNSSRKSMRYMAAGVLMFKEQEIALLDEKNKPIKNFEVDIRKATNHLKGAVVVCRPRFDTWKLKTKVIVDETLVDNSRVLEILQDSGHRVGIGSFRISKRGSFGQFDVVKWKRIE